MDCLSWCVCAAHKSGWLLRFPTLRKSAKDGAPSIAVRKEELKGGAPGDGLFELVRLCRAQIWLAFAVSHPSQKREGWGTFDCG